MGYHQPQGHFRYFTTQLRKSGQNYQDCQTHYLSRQPILQTAGLSQNLDYQKNEIQKSGTGPIITPDPKLQTSSDGPPQKKRALTSKYFSIIKRSISLWRK